MSIIPENEGAIQEPNTGEEAEGSLLQEPNTGEAAQEPNTIDGFQEPNTGN